MFTTQAVKIHPELPAMPSGPVPDVVLSLTEGGMAVGRVGLWRGPDWQGHKTGLVGTPVLLDMAKLPDLLTAVCTELKQLGADIVLGPLNGSTWFSYRLVTDWGKRPPFLLEPWSTPQELSAWRSAGFEPMLHYHSSAVTPETHVPDERAAELVQKFADVTIRSPTLNEPTLSHDLAALHALSLAAFAGNPLYSPLPLPAFEALYRPLLGHVPLDWVWLAERNGELVGFFFAYPDPASRALVLKTIAVKPGRAQAGLGRYLSHLFHARAFGAGVPEVIHALMWDGNESAAISAHTGQGDAGQGNGPVFRRYALLGRDL